MLRERTGHGTHHSPFTQSISATCFIPSIKFSMNSVMGPLQPFDVPGSSVSLSTLPSFYLKQADCSSRDEYVCMKSMVCDYTSAQREIKAYKALSKAPKADRLMGKRYTRQAVDSFELRRGDRDYHFLIHEPLGVSVQFFLDFSAGSLPIYFVKDLASQMLHALNFIHSAQVIHAGLMPP